MFGRKWSVIFEITDTCNLDCSFCYDCRACFYSCVWEPALLTSTRFLPAALHHLATWRKLRGP